MKYRGVTTKHEDSALQWKIGGQMKIKKIFQRNTDDP
jgi:hypothetical protein